jgi:hypothetical protein
MFYRTNAGTKYLEVLTDLLAANIISINTYFTASTTHDKYKTSTETI